MRERPLSARPTPDRRLSSYPKAFTHITRRAIVSTMPFPQPPAELLRRAQRGDERAVAAIVRMYEAIVFNYVLRLVGDRALAEDLSQEIFLGVYQALPRFSGRSTFTTWLFELTKNRVLDEMRAAARRSGRVTGTADTS